MKNIFLNKQPEKKIGSIKGQIAQLKNRLASGKNKKDITVLKNELERYRLALLATSEGILDFNLKTKEYYANPRFYHLLNIKREDFSPDNRYKKVHIHPEDKYLFKKLKEDIEIKKKKHYEAEFRIKSNTDKYNWLSCNGIVVRDKTGVPVQIIETFRDITKQKELEFSLIKSEEKYRSLIDSQGEGIGFVDEFENITFANPETEKIFGLPARKLQGKNLKDFLTEENFNFILSQTNLRKNGVKGMYEIEIVLTNGKTKNILVTSNPKFDRNKNYIGSLCIFRDITENKILQNTLRESEQRFRELADLLPGIVFEADNEGKFTFLNKKALELFGYSQEDFYKGISLFQLFSNSNIPKMQRNFLNLLESGKMIFREFSAVKKDGTLMPVLVHSNVIKIKNKKIGIRGIALDISDRKKWEHEIIQSRSLLSETQKMAKIGSFEYDTLSNKLIFSESFFNILEIDDKNLKTDFTLFNYLIYVHVDDRKIFEKIYMSEYEDTEESEYVYRIIDSKGKIKYILSYTTILKDINNEPIKLIFTIQDITQQKINEDLVKKAELAKETAQIKQQLLANLSHEIRTPMNGIMGMSEFLLKTKLNDAQFDYVSTIKKSTESLLNIINEILTLTRLEKGKMKLMTNEFSIHSILNEVKSLFESNFIEKNIHFEILISPEIPEIIIADETHIKEIIINLLSNAVKFTSKGSITLKTSQISRKEDRIKVKIEIIDTGIGISKENIDNVFVKFMQVDSSFTKSNEGIGLGLAITKELVELLNGKIGVESEINKGSNFWFTFDATASLKKREDLFEIIDDCFDQPSLNLNVLYAEDIFINQKIISMMLNNIGCSVDIAFNGAEAIEKFDQSKYDVIIMDIQMPVMDGITAVKELKKKYRTLPPIIGLSANAMEGDAERYISEGLDDYLSKPITSQMLYSKLIKWTSVPKS
jgi:PAS domain S-box-containing protein